MAIFFKRFPKMCSKDCMRIYYMIQKFTIFMLLIVIFLSCDKDDKNSGIIKITGIVERDEAGVLVKGEDNTDWNFITDISSIEKNLFDLKKLESCSNVDKFEVHAYPNPCVELIYLSFIVDDGYHISIRIVDSDLNVVYSNDNIPKKFVIRTDVFKGKTPLRIYYHLYNDTCELFGKGDIEIK